MITCKKCGNTYDETYGVCPKCGSNIAAPQLSTTTARNVQLVAQKNNNGKIITIISISAVVLIGVVIALVMLFSQPSAQSQLEEQISLGEKYLSEEKYDEAIVAFKKAIEIEPNDPQLYIQLANAYIGKGDTDSAMETLQKGYDLTNDDDIKAKLGELKYTKYMSLGETAYSEGKYDNAIESFEQAISLKPTEAKPYISESDCYIAKDDTENAIAILEKGYEKTNSDEIHRKLEELKNDNSDLIIETAKMTNDDIKSDWEYMEKLDLEYPIFKTNNEELRNFLDENITQEILSVTDDNYIRENKIRHVIGSYSYAYPTDGYLSIQCSVSAQPYQSVGIWNEESSYFADLKNKKLLALNDLFEESDDEIAEQLTERLNDHVDKKVLYNNDGIKYEEVYSRIENRNMIFMLDEDNLTIIFASREIATALAGPQKIEIPLSEIELTSTIPAIKTKKSGAVQTTATIIDSGTCGKNGDNVKWQLDSDGVLTISGDGEMNNWYVGTSTDAVVNYVAPPWDDKDKLINEVNVMPGITNIGASAFAGCDSLKNVSIPDSVTEIVDDAFSRCSKLKYIKIPNNVTYIGMRAFNECNNISSITIPYSATTMGYEVFSGWTSSQTIYIKGRTVEPDSWSAGGWRTQDWDNNCSAKIVWNA